MATKPHVSHGRAPLEGRARLVFERLGYSVTYDGEGLRAERDGKRVRVLTVEGPEPPRLNGAADADKLCLVTRASDAASLKEAAESNIPTDSELAVIGVEEDDYFVV